MLTSFTESTGSMAYVAMEQVTGKLGGKSGTFYLEHRATMTKGDAVSGEMNISIVKGSGTGELAGIRRADNHHRCVRQALLRLRI